MKMYQLEPAVAVAEPRHLRVARRTMTTSTVASPNCGDSALHVRAAGLHSISGPVRTPLPEPSRPSEPVPIWLAVLHATAIGQELGAGELDLYQACLAAKQK